VAKSHSLAVTGPIRRAARHAGACPPAALHRRRGAAARRPSRSVTSATNSGRTQCTPESTSGVPKRVARGGGTSTVILSEASGCSLFSKAVSSWCRPDDGSGTQFGGGYHDTARPPPPAGYRPRQEVPRLRRLAPVSICGSAFLLAPSPRKGGSPPIIPLSAFSPCRLHTPVSPTGRVAAAATSPEEKRRPSKSASTSISTAPTRSSQRSSEWRATSFAIRCQS
jgi:hypothetical protein